MTEEHIEKAALEFLEKLGFQILFGPNIAPESTPSSPALLPNEKDSPSTLSLLPKGEGIKDKGIDNTTNI